ncbi:SPOR domain-containing protein [Alkalilimnicola ehrlichii MLHE-1]|uniref:Sporulation domain protein n=1 Tax=Alkalilimnicola ehrlichii (strain ATCC BAA-1101 / DSM 17681 / MLHE-1) TaxID=187272 RepID=Q0A4X4_ALKEH|nr:SPOR domain-containing protein [Alkalilimnicola ehrlichii]ABI58113.1 Sporulation domain protein [Alkalilimnicola ehrlichii MLHE-1]
MAQRPRKKSTRGATPQAPRRRSKATGSAGGGGAPGWALLLVGVVLGAGLVLAWEAHQDGRLNISIGEPDNTGAVGEPRGPVAEPEPEPAQQRPRFEFYTLLPEEEVAVPEADHPDAGRAEADRAREVPGEAPEVSRRPTEVEPGYRYLLQAGSFRRASDAERMRANLALLGVEARIQRVELDGGQVRHRVQVGPFDDGERLDRIRARLEDNGYETLRMRASG